MSVNAATKECPGPKGAPKSDTAKKDGSDAMLAIHSQRRSQHPLRARMGEVGCGQRFAKGTGPTDGTVANSEGGVHKSQIGQANHKDMERGRSLGDFSPTFFKRTAFNWITQRHKALQRPARDLDPWGEGRRVAGKVSALVQCQWATKKTV